MLDLFFEPWPYCSSPDEPVEKVFPHHYQTASPLLELFQRAKPGYRSRSFFPFFRQNVDVVAVFSTNLGIRAFVSWTDSLVQSHQLKSQLSFGPLSFYAVSRKSPLACPHVLEPPHRVAYIQ